MGEKEGKALSLAAKLEAVLARWPVGMSSACALRFDATGAVLDTYATAGSVDPYRLASVSKAISALAFMVAEEEGLYFLDEVLEPVGASWRELLSHASGLPADRGGRVGADDLARLLDKGRVDLAGVREPRTRRTYSNLGYELAAELLARRAAMPFGQYVTEAVLEPLGMTKTRIEPSLYATAGPNGAAAGMASSAQDLARLAAELRRPHLVSAETMAEATSLQCGELSGVLPGFGVQENNAWGLGLEIRDRKDPHWMGKTNAGTAFGHFGQSGTFMWVDPDRGCALVVLTDRPFDDFAKSAWPALSDTVISSLA